jgi:hypothetical protein
MTPAHAMRDGSVDDGADRPVLGEPTAARLPLPLDVQLRRATSIKLTHIRPRP